MWKEGGPTKSTTLLQEKKVTLIYLQRVIPIGPSCLFMLIQPGLVGVGALFEYWGCDNEILRIKLECTFKNVSFDPVDWIGLRPWNWKHLAVGLEVNWMLHNIIISATHAHFCGILSSDFDCKQFFAWTDDFVFSSLILDWSLAFDSLLIVHS